MDSARSYSVDPQLRIPSYIQPFFDSISEESIEFRAAANSSVEPSKRPIRSRVLQRIAKSKIFEHIFVSVFIASVARSLGLDKLSASEILKEFDQAAAKGKVDLETVASTMIELLSRDMRFSTLVLEKVEEDKKWHDLIGGYFKSWKDRIGGFFEKISDKDHPISRTAVAALLSGASLVATYNVALKIMPEVTKNYLSIKIPITADPAEAKFKVDLDLQGPPKPIGISLAPADPVDMQFHPVGPIKVDVVATSASASSPTGANSGQPPKPMPAPESTPIPVNVVVVPKSIDNLASETKAYRDEVNLLKARLDGMGTLAQAVNEQLSNFQATTSITVPESESGTVFLQWFNEKLQLVSCELKTRVDKVGSTTSSVRFIPLNCSPTFQLPDQSRGMQPVQLEVNQPKKLIGLPFHVTATVVEHHWFGKSQIEFRFQQDAAPLKTGAQDGGLADNTSPPPIP
jgi:hypothetical protein